MEVVAKSKLNDLWKVYFSSLSGHDKIVRFVQYSTRFVIPAIYNTTEYFKMDPKIAKRYDRILTLTRKELSIARRTVRIFKQMQVLWTVYKLIKNFRKNREIPFKREGYVSYVILKSINNILASVFFSLDHVFWSYLIRLHRNKDLVGRVGDICDYVWIVQSCANMSLCLIEMGINQSHINKLNKKMKKINKEMKKSKKIENSEIENKKSELEKLAEKVRNLESTNSELPLEIVKSICDSITALYFLDRDYFSDWMIGFIGCLASCISMYRIGNLKWSRMNK